MEHGDALLSLADVHEAASRWGQALEAIEHAIAIFAAKGATAYVEKAEGRRGAVEARLASD